jgi:hypothetical protein
MPKFVNLKLDEGELSMPKRKLDPESEAEQAMFDEAERHMQEKMEASANANEDIEASPVISSEDFMNMVIASDAEEKAENYEEVSDTEDEEEEEDEESEAALLAAAQEEAAELDASAEALGDSLEDISYNAEHIESLQTYDAAALSQKAKAKNAIDIQIQSREDKRLSRSYGKSRNNTLAAISRTNGAAEKARAASVQARASAFAKLVSAKISGRIIRDAVIVGAESREVTDKKGNKFYIPVARIKVMGFYGYIQLDEMFAFAPTLIQRCISKTLSGNDSYAKRATGFINGMVGLQIPVVILLANYDPDAARPFLIVASRRRAVLEDTINYWRPPDEHAADRAASTKVGDITKATVVFSGNSQYVTINVRGVDIAVPARSLTNRYYKRVADVLPIGTTIIVRISRIEWPNDEYHKQHLLLNYRELADDFAKSTRRNAAERRHNDELRSTLSGDVVYQIPEIRVNGSDMEAIQCYLENGAEISNSLQTKAIVCDNVLNPRTKSPYIRLWLTEFNMPGFATRVSYNNVASAPAVGDVVNVSVRSITSRCYCACFIKKVVREAEGG